MTHKRNTTGLSKAAKNRREATIQRVTLALNRLMKENKKINFNVVSKEARVGKPWLYKETEIRLKIEQLREKTSWSQTTLKTQSNHKASDQSKENLIATLKDRVRKVEAENKELKQKLEVLYGQLCVQS